MAPTPFTEVELEHPAVAAAAVVVGAVALGFAVRWIVLGRWARVAANTPSSRDDAVIASLKRPVPFWFLLAGLYLALGLVRLRASLQGPLSKAIVATFIASVTVWATGLVSRLLEREAGPDGAVATPATGVVRQSARIVVLAVGGLVLLSALGIPVTPMLTTIGIGGLAVALGLQETLANLFAGMQITLAGNIRVGDFIRLESGEEGYVDDIHWRTTRVRVLANNFVLIPNSRLAQSVVTNFYRPTKDVAILVEVGVHYASDLDQVERVTCEVGRQVLRSVPGGVRDFEPFIRFHTFGDSSIDFTVILRAEEFVAGYLIKHEFVKALARAYAKERIVIPYPIRAVNLEQEKGGGSP